MTAVIEIRNLHVFYRTRRGHVRAVDDVNLRIEEGEALGLVGETGCGKSTLGKALLGVLPPGTFVRGEILFRMPPAERERMTRLESRVQPHIEDIGEEDLIALDAHALQHALARLKKAGRGSTNLVTDIHSLLDLKKAYDVISFPRESMRLMRGEEIALIFQDPMSRLDPLMSVRDHFLELIQAHRRVSEEEAEREALKALSSVGIPPSRLKNYPHEFSGGMRQRIMIAMGLVMDPGLLIADEPTTSLDVLVEAQILQLIERLKESVEMALLLITHNLGIVAETCDRVGVMYAGKLVEVAGVSQLFSSPKHPYTEGLLSSVIHLETEDLKSIAGSPPDLINPPSGCRFHPRCPHVMDICNQTEPPMIDAERSRAACFLYGEEHG